MSEGDVDDRSPLRRENGRNLEAAENGRNPEAEKERRGQIRHLEKEAFQLANYYVFQGVIFTAFYHAPSRLKCGYTWVPMTLSALAGVLNSCALFRIAMNYKRTLDEGDSRAAGGDSVAAMCDRWWRCFYVVVCTLFVLVFQAITLAGCWVIACGATGRRLKHGSVTHAWGVFCSVGVCCLLCA